METDLDTFISFKEWLIYFEKEETRRADVKVSLLRKAEKELKRKGLDIHSLYKALVEISIYKKGEILDRKMSLCISNVCDIYSAYFFLPKVDATPSVKKSASLNKVDKTTETAVMNARTAFIDYLHFLSNRFPGFDLKRVQEELLKIDDSKAIKGLTKWDPHEKSVKKPSKTGKIYKWLGWAFHNKGLSALFRKFGATVFSAGDEELVQIPMAQFHKFMEAYVDLYKAGNFADIYKNSSFILNETDDEFHILSFEEIMGQSIHLYAGNQELNFQEVKSMEADTYKGILTVDHVYYGETAIPLPIISGRKDRYRKLSYRTTCSVPILEQAQILSEIRKECRVISECLSEFSKRCNTSQDLSYEDFELVDVKRTVEAANNAFTLLRHFATLLRIDLMIE